MTLKNIPTLENYKTLIKSNMHLDQRIYNTPSISKVDVIWVENNELEDNFAQNKMERSRYYCL